MARGLRSIVLDVGRIATAFVTLAITLGVYASPGWANQPTVPARVRLAIIREYPGMAWVPGRIPSGFRYLSWKRSRKAASFGYQLNYEGASVSAQFAFQILRRTCPSAPSWPTMRIFRVNGRRVRWSGSSSDQYAWLCKRTEQGRSYVIFAVGGGPARMLADVVGFARPAS